MSRAFRWSWILLWRPRLAAAAAAAVAAFAVAVTAATFLTAARPGGSRLGDTPLVLAGMGAAPVAGELMGRTLMITGAVTLAVAAAHVGGSFTSGLVRVVFVRHPDRVTWLLGTWAALAVMTLVLSLLGSSTVLVTAVTLAEGYGVETSEWFSGPGVLAMVGRAAGVALALVGFTTAGVALAVLLRSPVAAVAVGLAYGLFEGLAAAAAGDAARLLPGQVLTTVSRGLDQPGGPTATLLAVLLVAGSLAVSAVVLHRRDVTE